jgi:hypothetical protein
MYEVSEVVPFPPAGKILSPTAYLGRSFDVAYCIRKDGGRISIRNVVYTYF